MSDNKRSPIKDNPLRLPGQSLQEEIDKVVNDEALQYIVLSVFSVVIALLEWVYVYTDNRPNPFLYSIVAVFVVVFSFYKLRKYRVRLSNLRKGYDGELAVGQLLEQIRKIGASVYHDIIFDGFNIDHVIVCNKGVFALETKTYSKPSKGQAVIKYSGHMLDINGIKTDRPLIQAKAAAKSLTELIKIQTGKSFFVKPVVLFPGWYIDNTSKTAQNEIWVLNPKVVFNFLNNLSEVVSKDEQKLISNQLSRYIRSSSDKQKSNNWN